MFCNSKVFFFFSFSFPFPPFLFTLNPPSRSFPQMTWLYTWRMIEQAIFQLCDPFLPPVKMEGEKGGKGGEKKGGMMEDAELEGQEEKIVEFSELLVKFFTSNRDLFFGEDVVQLLRFVVVFIHFYIFIIHLSHTPSPESPNPSSSSLPPAKTESFSEQTKLPPLLSLKLSSLSLSPSPLSKRSLLLLFFISCCLWGLFLLC